MHNTSQVEDEPYPKLLSEKGFRGFPSVCFMDAEGNVLTKPGRSVKAFVETHAETKALAALRAKGDKLSAAELKELFLAELKLDMIPAAEIQARSDRVPALTAAEKALVAQKIVDGEVTGIMQKAREAGPEKTAEALVEMAKAGRVPSETMSGTFWQQVLKQASTQKDGDLAQKAYDGLVKRYAAEPSAQFEQAKKAWQKQVDDAKAK